MIKQIINSTILALFFILVFWMLPEANSIKVCENITFSEGILMSITKIFKAEIYSTVFFIICFVIVMLFLNKKEYVLPEVTTTKLRKYYIIAAILALVDAGYYFYLLFRYIECLTPVPTAHMCIMSLLLFITLYFFVKALKEAKRINSNQESNI